MSVAHRHGRGDHLMRLTPRRSNVCNRRMFETNYGRAPTHDHCPAMRSAVTHMQEALQLVRKNAWLRASDLADAGVPRVVLAGMAASGQLECAARGLYRLPDGGSSEHEGLVTVASKVPRAGLPAQRAAVSRVDHPAVVVRLDCDAARKPCAATRIPAHQDGAIHWRGIHAGHRDPRRCMPS